MNTTYIEQIIKNIEEALASQDPQLSAADIEKFKEAKAVLEDGSKKTPATGLTEQEKSAIIQAFIIIMEVLKCVAEHYK